MASPPMAKILLNSATEEASLAARYWVSILVVLDQWMFMFVPFQNVLKYKTRWCQDICVCFNLVTIFTGQGDISKVKIFSQGSVDFCHGEAGAGLLTGYANNVILSREEEVPIMILPSSKRTLLRSSPYN